MNELYETLGDISSEIIEEWGKSIILKKRVLDPAWAKRETRTTAGVVTSWLNTVTGAVATSDPSTITNYKGSAVEGSYKAGTYGQLAIAAGDLRLYAVKIPKPDVGDIIAVNGTDLTVKSVTPVRPSDLTLLYDIQLR